MAESFQTILDRYTRSQRINPRKTAQGLSTLMNQGSIGAALGFGILSARADQEDAVAAQANMAMQMQEFDMRKNRNDAEIRNFDDLRNIQRERLDLDQKKYLDELDYQYYNSDANRNVTQSEGSANRVLQKYGIDTKKLTDQQRMSLDRDLAQMKITSSEKIASSGNEVKLSIADMQNTTARRGQDVQQTIANNNNSTQLQTTGMQIDGRMGVAQLQANTNREGFRSAEEIAAARNKVTSQGQQLTYQVGMRNADTGAFNAQTNRMGTVQTGNYQQGQLQNQAYANQTSRLGVSNTATYQQGVLNNQAYANQTGRLGVENTKTYQDGVLNNQAFSNQTSRIGTIGNLEIGRQNANTQAQQVSNTAAYQKSQTELGYAGLANSKSIATGNNNTSLAVADKNNAGSLQRVQAQNAGQVQVQGLRNTGALQQVAAQGQNQLANTRLVGQNQLQNTGLSNEGRIAVAGINSNTQLQTTGMNNATSLNVADVNNAGAYARTALQGQNQLQNTQQQGVNSINTANVQGGYQLQNTGLSNQGAMNRTVQQGVNSSGVANIQGQYQLLNTGAREAGATGRNNVNANVSLSNAATSAGASIQNTNTNADVARITASANAALAKEKTTYQSILNTLEETFGSDKVISALGQQQASAYSSIMSGKANAANAETNRLSAIADSQYKSSTANTSANRLAFDFNKQNQNLQLSYAQLAADIDKNQKALASGEKISAEQLKSSLQRTLKQIESQERISDQTLVSNESQTDKKLKSNEKQTQAEIAAKVAMNSEDNATNKAINTESNLVRLSNASDNNMTQAQIKAAQIAAEKEITRMKLSKNAEQANLDRVQRTKELSERLSTDKELAQLKINAGKGDRESINKLELEKLKVQKRLRLRELDLKESSNAVDAAYKGASTDQEARKTRALLEKYASERKLADENTIVASNKNKEFALGAGIKRDELLGELSRLKQVELDLIKNKDALTKPTERKWWDSFTVNSPKELKEYYSKIESENEFKVGSFDSKLEFLHRRMGLIDDTVKALK